MHSLWVSTESIQNLHLVNHSLLKAYPLLIMPSGNRGYIWSKATCASYPTYLERWFNWGNKVMVHYSMVHYLAEYYFVCTYMYVIAPIRIKTDKVQLVPQRKHSTGACCLCCGVFWNIFFMLKEIIGKIGLNFVFSSFTPKSQMWSIGSVVGSCQEHWSVGWGVHS